MTFSCSFHVIVDWFGIKSGKMSLSIAQWTHKNIYISRFLSCSGLFLKNSLQSLPLTDIYVNCIDEFIWRFVVAMFIVRNGPINTHTTNSRGERGRAATSLSYLTARERGGVQSDVLLTPTSCFSCQDVPSPWRPSGTRRFLISRFFKGVCGRQEIGLKFLRGNQFIS